jgi:hypothetical protein
MSDSAGFLRIIDVTDPYNPSTTNFAVATALVDVEVVGEYAFVANGTSNRLQVIDISNTLYPSLLSQVVLPQTPVSLEVVGKYAYVGTGNG